VKRIIGDLETRRRWFPGLALWVFPKHPRPSPVILMGMPVIYH
jgi:hypothetical protein